MQDKLSEYAVKLIEKADQSIGFKGLDIRVVLQEPDPEHRFMLLQKAFSEREDHLNRNVSRKISFPFPFREDDLLLVAKKYYDFVFKRK